MHKGPFAIGFFDLVLCGVLADPQHLIIIFPFALFQLQLSRLQQMLVVYSEIEKHAVRACESLTSRQILNHYAAYLMFFPSGTLSHSPAQPLHTVLCPCNYGWHKVSQKVHNFEE